MTRQPYHIIDPQATTTPMSMLRKGTTPLRSTPTTAPLEGMISRQQSHIDELVAKTRTLEHTIVKLQEALTAEQDRSQEALAAERERTKDALSRIQERWAAERVEWRDGCDALQSAHRVAHLRTACELEKERMAVLQEKENVRRERLAKAQRDYRLILFQSGERTLEKRIRELEEESEDQRVAEEEQRRALEAQMGTREKNLKTRCEELSAQLRDTVAELAQISEEKEKTEVCSYCFIVLSS